MSYILDALKRAEAQRHGIQSARSALPASFVAPPASRRATRLLPWIALLAAGSAAAILAFTVLRTPEPAAPATIVAPAPVQPAAAVTPTAVIIPPSSPAAPLPVQDLPVEKARPAALGTLRDLPPQVQREIPPLVIGGYLYSPEPADRSVLINNRLRREGDEIAPGLILESLQADGMVLDYRGYRYRSNY